MLQVIKKWWFWVLIVFVIFFLLTRDKIKEFENPIVIGDGVLDLPVEGIGYAIAAIHEEGWLKPVKLQVNDEGREDSPYITRDGRYILFYHHATPNFLDEALTRSLNKDPKIYYSERPFTARKLHPASSDDANAEAGPYISESGDFYYHATDIVSKLLPKINPNNILKNGEIIELGTGVHEGNPHYCDAMDELYFDAPDTEQIAVFKNGKTTFLKEPINTESSIDFQPFLTDDCQTMYFTSSRDATHDILPLQIYRSQRLGEFEWSEPQLFISFPETEGFIGGVGEFSMTRDGKQIVFLQLTIKDGVGQNDMYYAEQVN